MFINTVVPEHIKAKIMLVGEAPGKDENREGLPFVGYAGKTLDQLLRQAGIDRNECIVTNVFREQPPANNVGYYYLDPQPTKRTKPTEQGQEHIDLLKEEIEKYNPNVVIALGAVPLYHLTGLKGIMANIGTYIESTLVPGTKVFVVYHPQKINYEWELFSPTVMHLRKAKFHSTFPEIPQDRRIRHICTGKFEFIAYCKNIIKYKDTWKVAVDLEAHTKLPGCHISWVGFSHHKDIAYSLQILNGLNPNFSTEDELELWYWISKVLSSGVKLIFHNASFDVLLLWENHGIWCETTYMDTLLAAHCCWPELPRNLGFVSSMTIDRPAWKQTSSFHKGEYNADDAANTREIADILDIEMDKLGVRDTYNMEMAQLHPVMMMGMQGVPIDMEKKGQLTKEYGDKLEELHSGITILAGYELNLNSNKQIANLLYNEKGLPAQFHRRKPGQKEKKISVDEDALKKIESLHPIVKLILEFRKVTYAMSHFIDFEVSPENKVHTSYNIAGTPTGRWASSKSLIYPFGHGNLQNIDRKTRSIYVPPPGYIWLMADYIQAEAVVTAYESCDERLKQVFKDGEIDVHTFTASMMFGIPIEEVTKEQRIVGKRIRHGANYNMGVQTLAKNLECSVKEAKEKLRDFHNTSPHLRVWHSRLKDHLRTNRVVETALGRKRKFLAKWPWKEEDYNNLFESLYAHKPQSTIGDLLNLSLTKFYNKYGSLVCVAMQLHDAIYIWVKEEERFLWARRLKECMTLPIEINNDTMIVGVDFKWGPTWGDMEELKI